MKWLKTKASHKVVDDDMQTDSIFGFFGGVQRQEPRSMISYNMSVPRVVFEQQTILVMPC